MGRNYHPHSHEKEFKQWKKKKGRTDDLRDAKHTGAIKGEYLV